MRRLIVLLFLLSLTACAPFVKDGQPVAASTDVVLQPGQTIGQTLVAPDSGLQGIEIYLNPETVGTGEIQLHLRASSQSTTDLTVSSFSTHSVDVPGWYRFTFSSLNDSRGKDYYFFLELRGTGQIRVGTAPGDTYLDGALYQNDSPIDAQMTFRLIYRPQPFFLGYLNQVGNWIGILGIAIFLFIIPGWALLSLLWPEWSVLAWGEKLGLAGSVSLALYPLLFLWTDIVGLHLGPLYAWLPPIIGLGIILWRYVIAWKAGRIKIWTPPSSGKTAINIFQSLKVNASNWNSELLLPDLAFVAILILIISTRFWVIRSLDVPMWGDSYHHTMIAQLLVDHGGLFNSWLPYADLQTLTYHFGFHTAAAVFHWVSGLNLPQSVLWTGQMLNALAVIALYPLATRVGGNRWAGVGAVLVAGLLSPMPMFYVNWGRYTQLAGQAILPGAVYLAWLTLESKPRERKSAVSWRDRIPFDIGRMLIMWIVLSGLALTHYRILIFALLFFAAFFILRVRANTWRILLARIFWMGVGAGLLFLPWFIHTFAGKMMSFFASQLSTPVAAVSNWEQDYNAIGDLSSYLPTLLWLLFLVSILWGLWRREKSVALISLWSFLILLAANPQWLRLPGEGVLSNFAVFIAAYISVGILVGYLLGQVTSYRFKVESAGASLMLPIIFSVLVLLVGIWGARQRLGDLQVNASALATRPDIRAATWIKENTPQDARFLVNSFFAYGDTVIVGSDGGWWLPLLAQRSTTLPPLNYDSEQGPRSDYIQWINELTTEIQDKGIVHPDVLALLRARGITYVYIGQRQGRVNYGGLYVLKPEQLLTSSSFRLVYHQDRVWIFEIQ